MTNSNQKSGFVNKVKFALIGTLVLGGGSLALIFSQNLINRNQTQSNPQFNISNNNKSQGGKSGDIIIKPNPNPLPENNSSSNQKPGSSSAPTSPSDGLNPTNTTPTIDVQSANVRWSLKYPVYKIENKDCDIAGTAAVILNQGSGGTLNSSQLLNVYGNSRIQGTVTASGKVNISISSNSGKYLLTLDGENPQISSNETVITGKATMLGCPDSTFELSK
ncbi:hypothetical protein WJM97_13795 [Okeanomitos corallinicola TIOX110]|uniref:Uncharacterized protein n=1 Tax=Okeanomitos corallinicola TIOX110 TaxID=3133117 RepID=A0ABZ2UMV1_9CYAN